MALDVQTRNSPTPFLVHDIVLLILTHCDIRTAVTISQASLALILETQWELTALSLDWKALPSACFHENRVALHCGRPHLSPIYRQTTRQECLRPIHRPVSRASQTSSTGTAYLVNYSINLRKECPAARCTVCKGAEGRLQGYSCSRTYCVAAYFYPPLINAGSAKQIPRSAVTARRAISAVTPQFRSP